MDLEQKILELIAEQMRETVKSFEPFRSCIVCHEIVANGGLCSCDREKGVVLYGQR